MLFDPRWTKTHTLDDLIAWLETKDPNETYDYTQPADCLVGQWRKKIYDSEEMDRKTFRGCEQIAYKHPWTFGAALERALAAKH